MNFLHSPPAAGTRRPHLRFCSLTLKPHVTPVTSPDGIIFEESKILPLIHRTHINPITGSPLGPDLLVRLWFEIDSYDNSLCCPILRRRFHINEKIVAIATTGNVFSYEAIDKYNIQRQNMRDLIANKPFQIDDIIVLFDPHMHEWIPINEEMRSDLHQSQSVQHSDNRLNLHQELRGLNHISKQFEKSQNTDKMAPFHQETDGSYFIMQSAGKSSQVDTAEMPSTASSLHHGGSKTVITIDERNDFNHSKISVQNEGSGILPPITSVHSLISQSVKDQARPSSGPISSSGLSFRNQPAACTDFVENGYKQKIGSPSYMSSGMPLGIDDKKRTQPIKSLHIPHSLPLSNCTDGTPVSQVQKKPRMQQPMMLRPSFTSGKSRNNLASSSSRNQSDHFVQSMAEAERRAVYKRIRKGRKGKGYVRVVTNQGHLNIELHCDKVPRTCDNFLLLAERKYFDGLPWHSVIPGFIAQTGDPSGKGDGGESAWGGCFKDEIRTTLNHDAIGVVSMANSGRDSNRSQWFICFDAAPQLDGHHTVFGKVVGGLYVLRKMETEAKHGNSLTVEKIEVLVNPIKQIRDQIPSAYQAMKHDSFENEQQLGNSGASTTVSGSSPSQEFTGLQQQPRLLQTPRHDYRESTVQPNSSDPYKYTLPEVSASEVLIPSITGLAKTILHD